MKSLTYICSFLLIALGLVGYFAWEALGSSKQSLTALIPAVPGVFMLLGAIIANKKHMLGMHIAVFFSLLGALAGFGKMIPTAIKGNLDFDKASTYFIIAMTMICMFYTIQAVRSFIRARKAGA